MKKQEKKSEKQRPGTILPLEVTTVHERRQKPSHIQNWPAWIFVDVTVDKTCRLSPYSIKGHYRICIQRRASPYLLPLTPFNRERWNGAKTLVDAFFRVLAEALDEFADYFSDIYLQGRIRQWHKHLNFKMDTRSPTLIPYCEPLIKREIEHCELSIVCANPEFLKALKRDFKERIDVYLRGGKRPSEILKTMARADLVLITKSEVRRIRRDGPYVSQLRPGQSLFQK